MLCLTFYKAPIVNISGFISSRLCVLIFVSFGSFHVPASLLDLSRVLNLNCLSFFGGYYWIYRFLAMPRALTRSSSVCSLCENAVVCFSFFSVFCINPGRYSRCLLYIHLMLIDLTFTDVWPPWHLCECSIKYMYWDKAFGHYSYGIYQSGSIKLVLLSHLQMYQRYTRA